MLTIPTDQPWVPLRILGLGAKPSQRIEADVFLLTDDRPKVLAGGPGVSTERSESASSRLLADLRSDKGMSWVPDDMWLSYLQLSAPARELTYDLAVSTSGSPSVRDAGLDIALPPAPPSTPSDSPGPALWPIVLGGVLGAAVGTVAFATRRRDADR